jgi:hypothetical protein
MCIAGFFGPCTVSFGLVDCVGCELGTLIVGCCFCGLGSGLGLEETTAAFLVGNRWCDCKVGVGVDRTGISLKDWLDGLDGRGVDKVGGCAMGISWFIAFL